MFYNRDCFVSHKHKICKEFSYCSNCDKTYKNRYTHICHKYFCRLCLNWHDSGNKTCFILQDRTHLSIKKNTLFFILCGYCIGNDWLYMAIKKLNLSNMHDDSSDYLLKLPYLNDLIDRGSIINNVQMFKYLTFDFSFETTFYKIIDYLNAILLNGGIDKIIIICDNELFKGIDHFRINFGKTIAINRTCIKLTNISNNIVFKNLTNYIDLDETILSMKLSLNSCLSIFPESVLNVYTLKRNDLITLNTQSFNVEQLIGSKKLQFDLLLKDREYVLNKFSTPVLANSLLLELIDFRLNLLTKAASKLNIFFKSLIDSLQCTQNDAAIYNYNSSSNAAFALIRNCIGTNIPSHYGKSGILKNTSKPEIIFCQLLIKMHTNCSPNSDHKMYSMFSPYGQFRPKECKVSCDFFCDACKTAYFIEGSYKIVCQYHSKNKHSNSASGLVPDMSISDVEQRANSSILKFKKLSYASRICKMPTCCIMDANITVLLDKELLLLSKQDTLKFFMYKHMLADIKKNYFNEIYKPIDYQKCIMSQLLHTNLLYAEHNFNNMQISRFDLNSAYINTLKNKNLIMPCGNRTVMYGIEANMWFNNHVLNISNTDGNSAGEVYYEFAAIKAIVHHDNIDLPFFSIPPSNNKHGEKIISNIPSLKNTFLSSCQKCINLLNIDNKCSSSPTQCKHTQKQRSHIVHGLLPDFIYAKQIGYKIEILQVHLFKQSKHIDSLENFASKLMSYRNDSGVCNTDAMYFNYIAKSFALCSLGKFAFNIDRSATGNAKVLTSSLQMMYLIRQKKLKCYDFIKLPNDNIVCIANEKICRFDIKETIAHRNGVNALVFAAVSNEVRRQMYIDCTQVMQFKYTHLIRADVDCITLLITDCEKSASFINDIFKNESKLLKYKLDSDDMQRVTSYSKRAYSLEFQNKEDNVYKCCGLQLSYNNRFNKINVALMANKFIQSIHELKYDHYNRFNPPCAIPIGMETYTNSYDGVSYVFKCNSYGTKQESSVLNQSLSAAETERLRANSTNNFEPLPKKAARLLPRSSKQYLTTI